jgi:hypothetical protein
MPTENSFPGYEIEAETWEDFYESDEWWSWIQTQDVPDPQHQPWAYRAWVDSARRYFEEYNQAPPAGGPYDEHQPPEGEPAPEPELLPGPPSPPPDPMPDPMPDPIDPGDEGLGVGGVRGFGGDESEFEISEGISPYKKGDLYGPQTLKPYDFSMGNMYMPQNQMGMGMVDPAIQNSVMMSGRGGGISPFAAGNAWGQYGPRRTGRGFY